MLDSVGTLRILASFGQATGGFRAESDRTVRKDLSGCCVGKRPWEHDYRGVKGPTVK